MLGIHGCIQVIEKDVVIFIFFNPMPCAILGLAGLVLLISMAAAYYYII